MVSRPRKARFYLDENVPQQLGAFLKERGHAVVYCPPHLVSKMDVLHLSEATKLEAVLLTIDKEFKTHNFPTQRIKQSPGVVILSTSAPTPKQYQRIVHKLLKYLTRHSITGRLCLASIAGVTSVPLAE